MKKDGPIVIIEDDLDDQDLLGEVFKQLNYPNQIVFFSNGEDTLRYLMSSDESPFIILSDINMPKMNGFELREKIQNNEKLRLKCIPYLFFTTSTQQELVIDAYSKSAQGFFTKPHTFSELVRVMKNIVEYWKDCHSPNVIV
jgi:CheY-like chemotaxis protein